MTQRKYYLRIFERFFHGETAQRFEDSPHRYAMYVLYQKLLLRSARFGGKITYRGVYADIEEQLAREFDETPDMIRTVLSYFVKLGIMVKHERYIFFPEAAQLIGSECESAGRMRELRKRKRNRHIVTDKASQSDKLEGQASHSDRLQERTSQSNVYGRHKMTDEASLKTSHSDGADKTSPVLEPQEITPKPHQIADEEES